VGLDNIDLEACRDRGVMVVSTPQANTQAVVEYVFALMFDALRPRDEIGRGTAAERFHALRRERVGTQLSALTLGIVGFGRIGRRVGQVAHAIGMNLVVNDLLPEADLRKAVDYPFAFVDKPALLAGSDVVTLHVDGRAGNRGLIDATLLSHLRSTALLINTARGFVVDAGALAEWAGRYPQARVVLDVHEPEPPPADYPLHGLANVRLLPHLASRTTQALENMSWVVRDVVAVLQGEAPEHPA
jgi:phosphoglycerate dehydrogenase-like enzyme